VLGARDGFCSKPLNQAAIVNPDMAPFGSVYWSRRRVRAVRAGEVPVTHDRAAPLNALKTGTGEAAVLPVVVEWLGAPRPLGFVTDARTH
jgi:hypothetical protein